MVPVLLSIYKGSNIHISSIISVFKLNCQSLCLTYLLNMHGHTIYHIEAERRNLASVVSSQYRFNPFPEPMLTTYCHLEHGNNLQ